VGAGSLAVITRPERRAPLAFEQEAKAGVGPEPKQTSGHLDSCIEVDLGRIAWNFSQVKGRVKVPVMAVVKANAYGHGIVEVSRALEKAGADWLMVGKLEEAITLRETGISRPILNFGPFDRSDAPEIISRNISQSVSTDEVLALQEPASRMNQVASVQVDVDTGMGRTGVALSQALGLLEKVAARSHIRVDGISTTLTEDPEFDREQLRRFLEVCASAKARGIRFGLRHAASSAGILSSGDFCLDMVRPGITLYGYYPNSRTQQEDRLNLRPALKLLAYVVFIKDLAPGDSLSYHRVFKARKATRVATVGIGYGDGYPPAFGGKTAALVKNKKFPVLDAVTANHLMIELGDDREVKIGDEVILIDSSKESGLTADVLAEQGGISDYRILISLNPLIPRIYK
jgi:alanine racemase